MRTVFAILLISIAALNSNAQTVLMEQDVNEDTLISKWGPNKLHYESGYMAYYMPVGNVMGSDSVSLKDGASLMVDYGMYGKIRVSQLYSLVGEMGYRLNTFSFKNDDKNVRYQRLVASNVHLGLFNRFNFDLKRGNVLGNYLEFGASADYAYATKSKIKRKAEDTDSYQSTKLVVSGPTYINRFNYYAEAHLGFGAFVITGSYRFSDFLNKDMTGYNMPRLNLGLRIDFGGE